MTRLLTQERKAAANIIRWGLGKRPAGRGPSQTRGTASRRCSGGSQSPGQLGAGQHPFNQDLEWLVYVCPFSPPAHLKPRDKRVPGSPSTPTADAHLLHEICVIATNDVWVLNLN